MALINANFIENIGLMIIAIVTPPAILILCVSVLLVGAGYVCNPGCRDVFFFFDINIEMF